MPKPTGSPVPVPVAVTAAVRETAERYRVDLDTLNGTGVGGRVSRADVLAAAGQADRAERPAGEQAADDDLYDKAFGDTAEQPEDDAVFAQVWGHGPEQPEGDAVFAAVFGY